MENLEHLAKLGLLGHQDPLGQGVPKGNLALLVLKVNKEILDQQVLLDQVDQQENGEILEIQEQLVQGDPQGLLDQQDPEEREVHRELLVVQDLPGHQGHLDHKEREDHQVNLVL